MTNTFLTSKKYIIITILFIILTSFVIINLEAFKNERIQATVESKFLGKYAEYGNYTKIDFYNSRKPTLIQTKFDLFNPTYSLILNDCVYSEPPKSIQNCDIFTVFVFYLQRTSLLDFEVSDYKKFDVFDSNYNKIQDTLKKIDISNTEKSDGQTFRLVSPLSSSEIEKNNQKLEKQNQVDQSNEEYKKYVQTTYSSLLKPYIEILELVKTDNLTPQQIATNKQLASTKIATLQIELQQIQTQLNNNQNYTLKDGVTITPTQETKDYIQQFIDEMVKIKGENGIQ